MNSIHKEGANEGRRATGDLSRELFCVPRALCRLLGKVVVGDLSKEEVFDANAVPLSKRRRRLVSS